MAEIPSGPRVRQKKDREGQVGVKGRLDEATERSSAGKRAHIGANAELGAVLRPIMKIVDLLDGLNQYRFEDDAEKLAAWKSARNVPGPGKESEKVPGEDGSVSRAA